MNSIIIESKINHFPAICEGKDCDVFIPKPIIEDSSIVIKKEDDFLYISDDRGLFIHCLDRLAIEQLKTFILNA